MKSFVAHDVRIKIRRSRKGAWIEILLPRHKQTQFLRRSRKGAWIEMFDRVWRAVCYLVAPVRERGLKLLAYL